MKLTTLQEQATTVENNVQTSEEVAKTYEQKNKVRMKIFCEFLIICFFSLVAVQCFSAGETKGLTQSIP